MCQYGVVVRWFGSNSLWIEPTGFDPRWERSLFFLFDDSFQMNESSFTHKENLKSETVGTIRSLPTLISKKRMALVWTTLKRYVECHEHMSRSYTSKSRSYRLSRTCAGHEPICREHPTPPTLTLWFIQKDRPVLVEWPSTLTHDRPLWLKWPSSLFQDRPLLSGPYSGTF